MSDEIATCPRCKKTFFGHEAVYIKIYNHDGICYHCDQDLVAIKRGFPEWPLSFVEKTAS
jgi:hypothetical protein